MAEVRSRSGLIVALAAGTVVAAAACGGSGGASSPPRSTVAPEDVVPLKTRVDVGDWKVSVLGYTENIDDDARQHGAPKPPGGRHYALVSLQGVYHGEGSGRFDELDTTLVGGSGTASPVDAACTATQLPFSDREILSGNAVETRHCFVVTSSDAKSAVLEVRPRSAPTAVPVVYALAKR
jgi:hypothetical protein